jgi:hypothetical protein
VVLVAVLLLSVWSSAWAGPSRANEIATRSAVLEKDADMLRKP